MTSRINYCISIMRSGSPFSEEGGVTEDKGLSETCGSLSGRKASAEGQSEFCFGLGSFQVCLV